MTSAKLTRDLADIGWRFLGVTKLCPGCWSASAWRPAKSCLPGFQHAVPSVTIQAASRKEATNILYWTIHGVEEGSL